MLRYSLLPEVAFKDGKFLFCHHSQDVCGLRVVLIHLLLSYASDTPQPPTRGSCHTYLPYASYDTNINQIPTTELCNDKVQKPYEYAYFLQQKKRENNYKKNLLDFTGAGRERKLPHLTSSGSQHLPLHIIQQILKA